MIVAFEMAHNAIFCLQFITDNTSMLTAKFEVTAN